LVQLIRSSKSKIRRKDRQPGWGTHGKGQRTVIVAPPRTGKMMLLQNIAQSVTGDRYDTRRGR
jgi:hypothetical protein